MFRFIVIVVSLAVALAKAKTGDDHPTLPTLWSAMTDEPGVGKGVEQYKFAATPTQDYPSALWSDYKGCKRLIWIPNNYDAKRYLLGCDAVDCCYESQDGNQVEFQIPNVYYADPTKKAEVTYSQQNVTTSFKQTFEADAWSWCLELGGVCVEHFTAYTRDCDSCVNNVQLLRWQTKLDGQTYNIDFRDYVGFDASTSAGQTFEAKFAVPEVCQANNLLACS